MSGINKQSLLGYILGISLGIAASGMAQAGSITDPDYQTGDTLTAAKMQNIKNAVNDNDSKITNLNNNIANGTCGTGMTRVGPTCVDNARNATPATWIAAVNACNAAGKRLLTPGEYITARTAGVITGANGEFEWIDSVAHSGLVSGAPGNGQGKMHGGYMGPSGILGGDFLFGNDRTYDQAAIANIFYRCAR